MSLRRVSALAVLMLSLGSAVALVNPNSLGLQAIAQDTEDQREGRPDRGKAQLIQELNLTPDQTQRLQAIRDQDQDQISQRKQAARQARQELVDLMAGTASESQVREKYRQVEALKQQAEDARFDSLLAMREVLTPEQRRQFAERMQEHRGDHENRGRRGERS